MDTVELQIPRITRCHRFVLTGFYINYTCKTSISQTPIIRIPPVTRSNLKVLHFLANIWNLWNNNTSVDLVLHHQQYKIFVCIYITLFPLCDHCNGQNLLRVIICTVVSCVVLFFKSLRRELLYIIMLMAIVISIMKTFIM